MSTLVTIGLVVSKEKSFEGVDGRRRTTGNRALPSYKLAAAFGSDELNKTYV